MEARYLKNNHVMYYVITQGGVYTEQWYVIITSDVTWTAGQIKVPELESKLIVHSSIKVQNINSSRSIMTKLLKGSCKENKNSKNPSLLWKWVGGSRSHSDFFVENHPEIALNQYWYFGVVYHVYYVWIILYTWLKVVSYFHFEFFPCQWWVSKKQNLHGVCGWGELYPSFFWICGLFLTLKAP